MGEQKFLFGDADQVYNTLSTESTIIREEMETIEKRIENSEKILEILAKRKAEVDRAMTLLIKKDDKKKDEKKVEKAVKEVKKEKESAKKKPEKKK